MEPNLPPSEVMSKPQRRTWTFQDKLRIVLEAEAAAHGQLGLLLRREGLYSSQLNNWRNAYRKHGEDGLKPSKMGRPPTPAVVKETQHQLRQLERKNAQLQVELERARVIIEVQKKLCEMWNVTAPIEDLEDPTLKP
jgi:transposase